MYEKPIQLQPNVCRCCLLLQSEHPQNRISYLPETIGLATGLRTLNLQGNCLRDIPNGLCLLQILETLDLAQNMLVNVTHAV
ncbi:unnamed protein product [Ectocarpus sp. 13 AM-2016]